MLVNIMYEIRFVCSRGWALAWAQEIIGRACTHPLSGATDGGCGNHWSFAIFPSQK